MRTFYSFLLISIFSFFSLQAQYCVNFWNNPQPTGENLMSVYVAENGNYFTGGTAGLIMSQLPQRTTSTYFSEIDFFVSINFVNETVGYAVSNSGHLAKTINGGEHWNQLNLPYSDMLRKVVHTPKYPLVVLGYETIYVSQDEVNWQTIDMEFLWLSDISIISDEYLAVATYDGELLVVEIETGEFETVLETNGQIWVDFVDDRTGYLLTYNYQIMDIIFELYKTEDGGNSWELLPGLPIDAYPTDIYAVNSEKIFLLDSYYQQVYISEDGANSWRKIKEPNFEEEYYFSDLGFNSQGKIVLCGDSGLIFVSEDWGESWTLVTRSVTAEDLSSVSFIDTQTGWVSGDDNIFKTEDAGVTWQALPTQIPIEFGWIDFIHFKNSSTGFAFSNQYLFKTIDGGNSWETVEFDVPQLGEIYGMEFFDNNYGILYGTGIFVTYDGGDSWELTYFEEGMDMIVLSVQMYSELSGFAFGSSRLPDEDEEDEYTFFPLMLKTTDAGITWSKITNLPDFEVIVAGYFDNSTSGIVLGIEMSYDEETEEMSDFQTVVYRTDDLQNWELTQTIEDNLCIRGYFLNRSEGAFICMDFMEGGFKINAITQNGEGLAMSGFMYQWLNDIALTSNETGWVVGDDGSIIELACTFTSVEDNPVVPKNPINLSVSPNPASDVITIQAGTKFPAEIKVQLLDIKGNIVASENYGVKFGEISNTLNVSLLPSGTYYINFTAGNTTVNEKVIIAR